MARARNRCQGCHCLHPASLTGSLLRRTGEAFLKPTGAAAVAAAALPLPGKAAAFKPFRPMAAGGGGAAAPRAPAPPPAPLHDPHAEGAVLLNE